MGDEQKLLVGPVWSWKSHEEARPGSDGPKECAMDAKSLARRNYGHDLFVVLGRIY